MAKHAQPFGRVVEFGGRDINGSVRDLFGDAVYCSIDLADGPGVDVVGDAADVPLQDWDCVVCCEVLEHHPNPDRLVLAAARALVPGGVFLMTCAGPGRPPHSAVDGGRVRPGEHYANVFPEVLQRLLVEAGFARFDIDQYRMDVRCVAWR